MVQAIIAVEEGVASKQMVKFAGDLPKESIVEVRGRVVVPEKEVTGTSQKVDHPVKCLNIASCSSACLWFLDPVKLPGIGLLQHRKRAPFHSEGVPEPGPATCNIPCKVST